MSPADAAHHPDTLREGSPRDLASALADARRHTLALVDALAHALPANMAVRYLPELDPPLWLLGQLAWQEDWWIGRNPLRLQGHTAAAALAPRASAPLPRWDACFAPALTHPARWHQDLPDRRRLLGLLARARERTLGLLASAPASDSALQVYRAALWREDALREVLLTLCQSLGVPAGSEAGSPLPCPVEPGELAVAAGEHLLGAPDSGFHADHEGPAQRVALPAFTIDRAPLSWARFLPFIEAGGYDEPRHWSRRGWQWRQRQTAGLPRHLGRDDDGQWRLAQFGQWVPLDPRWPALHLSRHEAEAWCRWAGRRLPSEHEWEAAARLAVGEGGWSWGQAREWTLSDYLPLPGHMALPGQAWPQAAAGELPLAVLKGASHATAPRLLLPWARWHAAPGDHAGFFGLRSCAGEMPPSAEEVPATADAGSKPRKRRAAPRPVSGPTAAETAPLTPATPAEPATAALPFDAAASSAPEPANLAEPTPEATAVPQAAEDPGTATAHRADQDPPTTEPPAAPPTDEAPAPLRTAADLFYSAPKPPPKPRRGGN